MDARGNGMDRPAVSAAASSLPLALPVLGGDHRTGSPLPLIGAVKAIGDMVVIPRPEAGIHLLFREPP